MDRSVSVRFEFSNVVFSHKWNCLNVQNTPGKTKAYWLEMSLFILCSLWVIILKSAE